VTWCTKEKEKWKRSFLNNESIFLLNSRYVRGKLDDLYEQENYQLKSRDKGQECPWYSCPYIIGGRYKCVVL